MKKRGTSDRSSADRSPPHRHGAIGGSAGSRRRRRKHDHNVACDAKHVYMSDGLHQHCNNAAMCQCRLRPAGGGYMEEVAGYSIATKYRAVLWYCYTVDKSDRMKATD